MSSREVTLDGGSPWGFRMHGGADAQLPLRIARVNPGSKAALRGIREGDLISSINGRPTGNLSNAEAHALLRSAQGTLTLGLNQGATGSPKRRSLKQAQDIKDNSNRISVTSASSSTTTQQINEFKQTNGAHTENKTKGSPFTTPQGAPPNDNEQSRDEKNNVSATAVDKSVISGASDKALLSAVIMADNVAGSSRSRRQRKSRNNRKKSKNVNNSTDETDLIESSCSNESKIKQIETSNKISESNINDVISACKTVEFTTNESKTDDKPVLQEVEFCVSKDDLTFKTTEENICDVIPVLQNNKTVESCTSSMSNKVKHTTKKSKQFCGANKTIEETVYDVIPVPQASETLKTVDDKNDELTTKETKQAEITSKTTEEIICDVIPAFLDDKTLKTVEFCATNDVKNDVVTSKTTEEMMCDVIPAFQDARTIKTVEFCTSSTSNKVKRTTKKSKQVSGANKTIEENVYDVIPAFQDDKKLKTVEFCASSDDAEGSTSIKQTKESKQVEVTSKTIEETICDVTPVLQDGNTLKTVDSNKVKHTTKKSKQAHGTTKTTEENVYDVISVPQANKILKTVDIKDDGQKKMHDVRLAFQDDKTLKTVESCASSDFTESSTSIKQTKESKQVEVTPKTIEETICDVTPSNTSNKVKRTTKKLKQAHGTTKTIEENIYDVIPIPQTSKELKTVEVKDNELPTKETKQAELTSKTTEEIICDVTHASPDVKTLKTVEFCASSVDAEGSTSSKQTKESKQVEVTSKTIEETICDVTPVLQDGKILETIESCTSNTSNKVKRTTKKSKQACGSKKTIEENVYDVIPVPQPSKTSKTIEFCTTNDVKNDELTTNEIIIKTAEKTICDVTPVFQDDTTLKTVEFCASSDVTKDSTSIKQTKELKQVEVTLKTIEETICDVTTVLASNDINKSLSTTSVAPKTTDNKIEFPKTSEPNKSNTAPESAINSDVISASNKIELSKTSELINETYRVEFPKKLSNMIKSRSLDDDDIKITEITEEINCLSESQAIVSEADSDIEWETVNEIQKQNKQFGKLSIITLPLEEHVTYETSHISPEDERSLRDFLQGLNLVNSPEESAKKIKKRTALPYYQIPRFLDVISEEGSDVSDRDNKQKTVFLPRLFNQDEDDDDDDVFEEADFEQTKLRHKYDDVPILVGTKLINNDSFMKEASWSTSMAETQSGAELVFLEDSSNSLTPSDLLDTVGDVDADDEDDKSFEMEITSSDLTSRASLPTDTEIKSETSDTLPNDNSATPPTETTIDFLQKLLHTFSSDENEIQQSNEVKQSDSARTSESRSNSAQSQCTAVYNPHHSSLTNIAALLREGSCENKTEPQSLRDICIQTLLDLPFGGIVIEELAKVSKSLEEMTCQPPSCTLTSILTSPPPIKSTNSTASSFLPVASPVVQSMGTNIEKWTGMPSEENPNIVVCLSPSQKQFIDKIKTVPHEADSLLDLHRKFIERRTYQDDKPKFKIQVNSNNNYIPFGQNPFGQNPFGQNAFGQTLFGQNPFGQIPLGQNTFEQNPSEQNPSEQNPFGQNHFGQNPSEQNPLGQNTFGQNTFGQNPSRQNAFGQNPLIQSAFGRKPLGQNTFGQNPLVQNAFGQIPLEQNSFGQIPLGQNPLLQSSSGQNPLGQNASGHNNIQYDKYIKQLVREVPIEVEKQINKPVNNKIYRNAPQQELGDRLKARHLGEWLNLARNENKTRTDSTPRRYSLPFELYEEQMKYILEKEREIQNEIDKLNEEKSKLETKTFDAAKYQISKKGDIAILSETFPNTEKFREKMYNEYMDKVAEREERKQSKVLKIKISEENHETNEAKHVFGIEDEFMHKVREKQEKLGLLEENIEQETTLPSPVKVLDGDSLTDVTKLPKHLQEFIDITTNADSSPGVWSPGKNIDSEPLPAPAEIKPTDKKEGDESAPVVWTPRSAGSSPTAERKEFRPVNFESPILKRKNIKQETSSTPESTFSPPWHNKETINTCVTSLTEERRLTSSQSAPAAGLTSLGKLPRAQNPTITLLQKAREGQLPRGASYIEDNQPPNKDIRPPLIGPNEILYTVKNEYISESETEKPKKMADLGSRKFEGIGPTTKDGMPIVLRSIYDEQEVKDSNQARWYKRMYDTLHRARNDEEYVTVRYKTRRGRYPYTSAGGYLSEPEPNAYDSDAGISANKYATLDRRRYQSGKDKENEYITYTVPRNKYMSASVRHSTDVYKNQPGRIEDYVPGHSSISEKEAKEWWDDVMEIFDGWLDDHSALPSLNYMLSQVTARSHLEQQKHVPPTKSFMSHALKESGYESDSTLVFRRREDAALQINPHEQKEAYKSIQKGGEVPLHGLRKLAPERPKEDSQMEYFPISPTLTRIRVHKNVKTVPSQIFSTYKRTAPSLSKAVRPPSPPKRKSSRNSHTLRLISTMTVRSPKSSQRHETCFKTSNVVDVKSKLNSTNKKVTKTVSDSKNTNKGLRAEKDKPVKRTFGAEKRKLEVKKVPEKQKYPPGTTVKKSTAPFSSSKSGLNDKSLNVTVAVTAKGKKILNSTLKDEKKKGKKVKKDQTNAELKSKKCAAKAAEIPKKESIPQEFFQNLLLRDYTASPTPSLSSKSSYILEKTKMFENRPAFQPGTTVATVKVYLTNRKPVSESKFKVLDREIMRSRSASPFLLPRNESVCSKRSLSLPATSRSISPICSPSRKKIIGIRNVKKCTETLQPSVSTLTLMHDPIEYRTYVAELRHSAQKSDRFKELNHFYSSLERLSYLERTTSSSDLRPRRRNEDEIIDYDRWMQVRKRERAEDEFNYLYQKLKQEQKEKDLLFKTKDVENFRWNFQREFGLKIKENSVENIKEQFEKLKYMASPLEISKRRLMEYQKDTYKPLWRGDSVINLVTRSERRSQSEGREKYSERLLNREIGAKLWSSLSVEQVNTLKNQLAQIYTPDNVVKLKCPKKSLVYNKQTSEISENEKKRLSLSLSQEVKDRKYKSALSVNFVPKKIEYFEKTVDTYVPTVHKPAEDHEYFKQNKSQSCADLKELFGERELMKFATIPLSATRAPKRPALRVTNFSPDKSISSSFDDVSAETDQFWNAYLSLIKGVDVGELTRKFEHLKVSKSDSELTILNRGRSRTRKQITKGFYKGEDRLMPHINIISKLASLYPKKLNKRERSIEDLAKTYGCPLGEVKKHRQKFEGVSLLGQMFTSSPNIHELRDIAPYLAGPWIAHQYPKLQDNSRSASAPEENGTNRALIRRNRPKSASPTRSNKSILKSEASPISGRTRSWSPIAKHSVKFKEPTVPTPPPMDHHDNNVGPESPRKYVEDEVTIHYRSPIRHEVKEALSEEELARRQAEAMRRIYQEERRRKYLQELQDMNSRRHTDNFTPSQKSPIPLNRYDDFGDDLSVKFRARSRSPEPRIVARALYNFVGQSARELSFRKGDIIFIRRQIDKNWFEGEHNAMIGLFPSNYVEIIPYDGIKSTPRKAHEGQARAKFNFIAQTNLELSLAKGELVVLTRRVDDNWFEGRIGSRKGIFPVSYVEILIDPGEKSEISGSTKPVASPAAHSLLLNGSAGGKESMGSHHYQPSFTAPQTTTSYHAKPVNVIGTSYSSMNRTRIGAPSVNEALHIDTQSEPVPYRALYKYRPQNDDELELQEGDTVFVLEKCDDGWYVGSSQRTGSFGTFPGNYVERI